MSTPTDVRAYVNERGVSVPVGALAIDAVRVNHPELADAITDGSMRLTDSRGLPIDADTVVSGGAIFRVVLVRAKLEDGE